jgi:hypothetical protein
MPGFCRSAMLSNHKIKHNRSAFSFELEKFENLCLPNAIWFRFFVANIGLWSAEVVS